MEGLSRYIIAEVAWSSFSVYVLFVSASPPPLPVFQVGRAASDMSLPQGNLHCVDYPPPCANPGEDP